MLYRSLRSFRIMRWSIVILAHLFICAHATTYEAEAKTASSYSTLRTGSWASGGQFQDMYQSSTAYVEWNNVDGGSGGTFTLEFRYANGHTYNRTCNVIVNSTTVATLDFAPTGSWSTPAIESITAGLNSGNNTIRLQAANTNGGPDFDKMDVETGSGLAGHWKLDETSGSVADDSSANANDGTVFNPSWTTGKIDGALQTDGSTSYVEVANPYGLPAGTQAITLAAWARTSASQTGWKMIVAYGTDSTGQAIYLGRNGSSFVAGAYADNLPLVSNVWGDGTWHHVALTYNGTTAIAYLDGTQVQSATKNWNIVPDLLRIGRQINVYNEYWSGTIDDVRIYDSALSSSEIADLADTTPVATSVYEAEDKTASSYSTLRTGSWASGGQFQDMYQSSTAYVEWNNVDGGSGGTASLEFTYANGSTYDRPCNVIVNSTTVATLDFPPTGSWSTPGTQSVTASLNSGNNTVRLQSATAATGVDLDKLEVSAGSSGGEHAVQTNIVEASSIPNPVGGVIAGNVYAFKLRSRNYYYGGPSDDHAEAETAPIRPRTRFDFNGYSFSPEWNHLEIVHWNYTTSQVVGISYAKWGNGGDAVQKWDYTTSSSIYDIQGNAATGMSVEMAGHPKTGGGYHTFGGYNTFNGDINTFTSLTSSHMYMFATDPGSMIITIDGLTEGTYTMVFWNTRYPGGTSRDGELDYGNGFDFILSQNPYSYSDPLILSGILVGSDNKLDLDFSQIDSGTDTSMAGFALIRTQ